MLRDEIINARIGSTMLGIEDHGILTFVLHLETEHSSQGFGTFILDCWDSGTERRIPSPIMAFAVRRVLDVVGVYTWEELKGKYVRYQRDKDGYIARIGHITDDCWFEPKVEFRELEVFLKELAART